MTDHTKNEKLIEFIEFYNSLPLKERYPLGKFFYEQTGGKLSPHNNPLTVAVPILQVEDENGEIKLLGLKRGIAPHIGGVAFPGGYTEYLENGHYAAARELKEELGLDTNPEDYEVFGNPLMSPTNNMLLFFKHKDVFPYSILKEIKLSSEALDFVLIDKDTEMCFSHHRAKADAALALFEQKNKLKM